MPGILFLIRAPLPRARVGNSRRRARRGGRPALVLAAALAVVGCSEHPGPSAREGLPRGPYQLSLSLAPDPPPVGVPVDFTFRLRHTASQTPVSDLQIVHERALHTFVVAEDFSSFAHVHQEDLAPRGAEDVAAGTFRFPYVFPAPGPYRVVSEFTHRDRAWVKTFRISVGGIATTAPMPAPDYARQKQIDGITGVLRTSPAQPIAGHETELVLALTRDGTPVGDLALLLGSEVHAALWRRDGQHFGHAHSHTPEMAAMMKDMAEHPGRHSAAMMIAMMSKPARLVYRGPEIPLRYTFPTPGDYQLFLQCAPGGRPHVFPFTLHVDPWTAESDTHIESIVPAR